MKLPILFLATGLHVGLAHAMIHSRRMQPQSIAACGDVLASWTSSQVQAILENGIDRNLGEAGAALKALALPLVRYGVQVRKVCAICSDYLDDCGYGGEVAHSGLLMLPLEDDDSTEIATGTHKAIISCHGTRAVTQPSTDWAGEDSDVEIILNALYTATTRSVSIMPDYMGQGESFGQVYRGYIVRDSYETSVVPLLLESTKIMEDETECSMVSDSVFLLGYSEGGYASLAVADRLSRLGYNILRVHSGGAPYWVSSGTFVDIVQFINEGIFPRDVRYYLAYLGFSFSSSRSDMPNFEMGQDLLTASSRQAMLDYLESDLPKTEDEGIENANNVLVPQDDLLSIYDSDFIAFIQEAISEGDLDPCTNRIVEGTNDLLCQAMQKQDIHQLLLNVSYPVTVCHSPDEEIVSFRNVPEGLLQNPMVSYQNTSGTHEPAGNICNVASTVYVLTEFRNIEVGDTTYASCPPNEETSTAAPTSLDVGDSPMAAPSTSGVGDVYFAKLPIAALAALAWDIFAY